MNFRLLERYLDSLGEEYGLPGFDILVTKDHETVYRHMAGFADAKGKKPVSDLHLAASVLSAQKYADTDRTKAGDHQQVQEPELQTQLRQSAKEWDRIVP